MAARRYFACTDMKLPIEIIICHKKGPIGNFITYASYCVKVGNLFLGVENSNGLNMVKFSSIAMEEDLHIILKQIPC